MAKKEQKSVIERPEAKLPLGVTLLRTLVGHKDWIGRIAWSPDGMTLASPSADKTIRLWNAETGECLRTLVGHSDEVNAVAFDRTATILASGGEDGTIMLWDVASGELRKTIKKNSRIRSVAFSPSDNVFTSGSADGTVSLWDPHTGESVRVFEGHAGAVNSVPFDPTGRRLASCADDKSIRIWDVRSGELLQYNEVSAQYVNCVAFTSTGTVIAIGDSDSVVTLWNLDSGGRNLIEGHTDWVLWLAFESSGKLLASIGSDGDIRLWRADNGLPLATIPRAQLPSWQSGGLSFHPQLPLLATVGWDPTTTQGVIHIWELNLNALLNQPQAIQTSHYVNAKIVLLGDTGVGKSGLSLVLNGKRYKKTDSTPGRKVWTFCSQQVLLGQNLRQTREALLWDLAGQPGYRVIHQLHLNEVAVALVVFDARSETDPLAGVRHWDRALRLAQQRQRSRVPMKKFLVSARNDRGTVSVSKERLDALLKEFEFDGYFETSAKEGWQIKELRQAIEEGIPWNDLPEVSSSVLFADIKSSLMKAKKTGRLVAPVSQLYDDFARAHPKVVKSETSLSDQFETCIGRLENRDLIRRLSFGDYVLLQPELLDAYASAMVNGAKEEPDGLGSIAEEAALAGQFYVPKEQKVFDRGQEQLLLHATVEELARHDLALRESAADGRYIVFPSQFNRDYEAAPEPKGKALALTFDGPVQSLYSTLAVRLGHSGLFTTGRAEMWRNAAVFTAKAGGKCGLYLHEFEEARGRLVIFYDQHEGQQPSDETRFHFEEFVQAHAQRHALNGTVQLVRFFICSNGHPVPDDYVKLLRDQGKKIFDCPCGVKVSLAEPIERLKFTSKVEAMDRSADRQRAFEMFVESARGETSTPGFTEWAGDDRVTLAIVFTDVVGSTALGEELKDAGMNELRKEHFAQSRKLIGQYNGREIKTIGDSFMAAFRSVGKALDYAVALQTKPGHEKVRVRAGIHIGSMTVEENDVFGGTVNFAARVVSAIKGPEIWLSDQAKADLDSSGAKQHTKLKWGRQDGVEMKGFNGTFTLWSLEG
jgi:WD40 repeat protein/class 3 adenylate cyclase/GTPase SAR1 family protein